MAKEELPGWARGQWDRETLEVRRRIVEGVQLWLDSTTRRQGSRNIVRALKALMFRDGSREEYRLVFKFNTEGDPIRYHLLDVRKPQPKEEPRPKPYDQDLFKIELRRMASDYLHSGTIEDP